jgi:transcriptional regulator with XRE-family HTH domain
MLRIRQARKLTQPNLAELSGVPRSQISIIENGRRNPRLDTVLSLATALEVSVESLIDGISWKPAVVGEGEFLVEDPPELPRV